MLKEYKCKLCTKSWYSHGYNAKSAYRTHLKTFHPEQWKILEQGEKVIADTLKSLQEQFGYVAVSRW